MSKKVADRLLFMKLCNRFFKTSYYVTDFRSSLGQVGCSRHGHFNDLLINPLIKHVHTITYVLNSDVIIAGIRSSLGKVAR